jgi:hypothetical protein
LAASVIDTVGVSDSSPLVADSLADVSVLLDDGVALVPEVPDVPEVVADGEAEVADDSALSLAVVDGAVVSGDVTAVLGAVVVTGASSAVVTSAPVGSAGATVVTGGATVVGGASTVASAVAVAVAAGRGTCGTAGAGASAGACGASSTGAVSSGSGAITVVVASVPSPGWASAGAIPPVSAVREITMPDASTATTPRFEQISSGVPTFTTPSVIKERVADHHCCQKRHRPAWKQKRSHAPFSEGSSLVRPRCYTQTEEAGDVESGRSTHVGSDHRTDPGGLRFRRSGGGRDIDG